LGRRNTLPPSHSFTGVSRLKPVRRLPDLTEELEHVGVGKHVNLAVKRDGRNVSVDVDVVDVGHRT
jgi:hypothetical protein